MSSDNSEIPTKPISHDEINMNLFWLEDSDLYIQFLEPPPDYFYYKYDPDVDLETRIWREGIIARYERNLQLALYFEKMKKSRDESAMCGLDYKEALKNDSLEKTHDTLLLTHKCVHALVNTYPYHPKKI